MGIEYSTVKRKNTQGKNANNAGWSIIMKNIARIAKLPKIMSELKKMSFLSGGRTGRYVRKVGQWVRTTKK